MARPRKPTNIIELSGGFKKNPKRREARANEPQPTGEIGEPPDTLSDDEKRCWREMVAEAPPGVLSNADRGLLLIVAGLRVHAERGDLHPETGRRYTDAKKLALLVRCYTELGFTPASRSKVKAKQEAAPEENEFAAV